MNAEKYELLPADHVEQLKTQVLNYWDKHEKSEVELGRLLYDLWLSLRAPGKKGAGFEGWLKANHKSRTTAYRYIDKYVRDNGLLIKPERKKKSLCHVAQTQPNNVFDGTMVTIHDVKQTLAKFMDSISESDRLEAVNHIKQWLTDRYAHEADKLIPRQYDLARLDRDTLLRTIGGQELADAVLCAMQILDNNRRYRTNPDYEPILMWENDARWVPPGSSLDLEILDKQLCGVDRVYKWLQYVMGRVHEVKRSLEVSRDSLLGGQQFMIQTVMKLKQ